MNITPKISVIIPVYNVEKYLNKCIDSVLSQTYTNFELILIDDGSTDSSSRICDEYAQKDNRVIVVHKKNGGVSAARNMGLELSKGEYITFVDSDDYVDADFFEVALKEIVENNADVFVSGLTMEYYNNGHIVKEQQYGIERDCIYITKELLEAWAKEEFPSICMCGPWCKLYKSKTIKNKVEFNESMSLGEDTYFNLDVLLGVEKLFFSKCVFYHYRRENENSLFSRLHKNIYEILQSVYEKRRNVMVKNECGKDSFDFLEKIYFYDLTGNLIKVFQHKGKTTKKERKVFVKKIALDANVRKLKIKQINRIRFKLILLLLKLKMYNSIMLILKLKTKKV